MSGSDRRKWDARYRSGATGDPGAPSRLLLDALGLGLSGQDSSARLPDSSGRRQRSTGAPRALDLACGRGRNALFLAAQGYSVDAVDLSGAALAEGQRAAGAQGLAVNWLQADLDSGVPLTGPYDLVVMIRYLNLALLADVKQLLAPGGVLVVEVYLAAESFDIAVAGPSNRAYLAEPGALPAACADLEVLLSGEGLVSGPAGRIEALSRIVARRSG
jgi:SAM-dependent methyltransferase